MLGFPANVLAIQMDRRTRTQHSKERTNQLTALEITDMIYLTAFFLIFLPACVIVYSLYKIAQAIWRII